MFYPIALTGTGIEVPASVLTVGGVGFVSAAIIGSMAWYNARRPQGWQGKQRPDFVPNLGKDSDAAVSASGLLSRTESVSGDGYDRGIVPAETAARREREGQGFKQKPESASDLDTTSGYTMDREGLMNNYAVEPEMYVEEVGDRRDAEGSEGERRAEYQEIQQTDEDGLLSVQGDQRGKGVGVI